MSATLLLQRTDAGLYSPPGDFYIDPWRPVGHAVLTHAHADHARPGSRHYLAAQPGRHLLRLRLGPDADLQTAAFGELVGHRGVRVSLHPAGHVLGSAQVRVEHRGAVWVVSGDYRQQPNPTCEPFEPVRCHTFVTESTFGLPIYRWPEPADVFAAIKAWWRANREAGQASLLYGYALGKGQRLLAELGMGLGPVYIPGAVDNVTAAYRVGGIQLPPTLPVAAAPAGTSWAGALVLALPSAHSSAWARKFGLASTALASGWMRLRGARRCRAVDRGFVLSDHADWPDLLDAVRESGAQRVWVTHGCIGPLVRWLCEQGLEALGVPTPFEGEVDEAGGEDG